MGQVGLIKNSTTSHLSAKELADIYNAVFYSSGIIKCYSDLACTKVNDTTVRMAAGVYSLSGYLLAVQYATTLDLSIDAGTAGQNRSDLVIAEYIKNGVSAGVDTLQFRILKGTSTSGTPSDPALTFQAINASGITGQEAVWRVNIVGTLLDSVEQVAATIEPIQSWNFMATLLAADGVGSGINADLLDNREGDEYFNTGSSTQTKIGNITIEKDDPKLYLVRLSGETGQYASVRVYDAATQKGGYAYDFTNDQNGVIVGSTFYPTPYVFLDQLFTWNPNAGSAISDGAAVEADVTVADANYNDMVFVSPPYSLQGCICTAYITASTNIKVRIQNETGGPITFTESASWNVRLLRM